jgi:hypothetical protein
MSPVHTNRSRTPRSVRLVAALVFVAVAVAGCGNSFDPTGPCTADGTAPGAYPDLEAVVPKVFAGTAPRQVDSGRTCSTDALGTLTSHGVKEMRFAGATWGTGTDSGLTLAVFVDADGPPLDAAWLAEFYEAGARTGKNVQSVDPTDLTIHEAGGDVAGRRIDVLNGESYQTVVIWPRDGRVAVVLVADFIREIQTRDAHDKVVATALAAYTS